MRFLQHIFLSLALLVPGIASAQQQVAYLSDIKIPTITIGTVAQGTAAATITGSNGAYILNLTLPQGATGNTSAFSVGTVSTGAAGSQAAVTITGTSTSPVLNFTIPQGATGAGGTGSSVALKTNGTANGSQSTLNLVPGANVALSDNGSGSVTVAVTGLGSAAAKTAGSAAGNVPVLDAFGKQPLTSNPVTQPYGMDIYGDSTTFGWGATDYTTKSAASILAADIGGPYRNFGVPGDSMEEIALVTMQNYVRPPLSTTNNLYRKLFVMAQGGINNANLCANTTAGCLSNYNQALDAFLTWLTQPTDNYYLASTASTSGAWAVDTTPAITAAIAGGTPMYTGSANATLTFTVPNSGSKIGIDWIGYQNTATTGTFTVAIDGVLQTAACSGTTTFYAYGCNSGTFTFTGGTNNAGPAPQRQSFPVTSGVNHTVVITNSGAASQKVSILAVDTNRAYTSAYPVPVVSMSGVMQSLNNATAPASFAAYDAADSAMVAAKIADGAVNLFFTPMTASQTYANGASVTAINSSSDMSNSTLCPHDGTNQLHPNNCGHQHWADNIEQSALGNGFGFAGFRQGPHPGYIPGPIVTPNGRWKFTGNNGGNATSSGYSAYISGQLGTGIDFDTNGGYVSALVHEYDTALSKIATSLVFGYQGAISIKECYGTGASPYSGSAPYTVTTCPDRLVATDTYVSVPNVPLYSQQVVTAPEAPAFSATPTFSAVIEMTTFNLTGNVTSSTLAAPLVGAHKTVVLCQDATGSRTFTWPATVKGVSGITGGTGQTASTCSTFDLIGYNSSWYLKSSNLNQ